MSDRHDLVPGRQLVDHLGRRALRRRAGDGRWDLLLAGRPVYNVSIVLRLEGALDSDALQRALGEIVRRHETLRTRFGDQAGRPVLRSTTVPAADLDLGLFGRPA